MRTPCCVLFAFACKACRSAVSRLARSAPPIVRRSTWSTSVIVTLVMAPAGAELRVACSSGYNFAEGSVGATTCALAMAPGQSGSESTTQKAATSASADRMQSVLSRHFDHECASPRRCSAPAVGPWQRPAPQKCARGEHHDQDGHNHTRRSQQRCQGLVREHDRAGCWYWSGHVPAECGYVMLTPQAVGLDVDSPCSRSCQVLTAESVRHRVEPLHLDPGWRIILLGPVL